MNMLVISDCHGAAPLWPQESPDIILLLGDNEGIEYQAADRYHGVPVFGVPGNHDGFDVYHSTKVWNLHGLVVDFNGLRIGGLGGCLGNKDWDYPWLFCEKEYWSILSKMPPVDIFISHVPPTGTLGAVKKWLYPRKDNKAHEGSAALWRYILRSNPKVLLHGHLHCGGEIQMRRTQVVSVYGGVCLKYNFA